MRFPVALVLLVVSPPSFAEDIFPSYPNEPTVRVEAGMTNNTEGMALLFRLSGAAYTGMEGGHTAYALLTIREASMAVDPAHQENVVPYLRIRVALAQVALSESTAGGPLEDSPPETSFVFFPTEVTRDTGALERALRVRMNMLGLQAKQSNLFSGKTVEAIYQVLGSLAGVSNESLLPDGIAKERGHGGFSVGAVETNAGFRVRLGQRVTVALVGILDADFTLTTTAYQPDPGTIALGPQFNWEFAALSDQRMGGYLHLYVLLPGNKMIDFFSGAEFRNRWFSGHQDELPNAQSVRFMTGAGIDF